MQKPHKMDVKSERQHVKLITANMCKNKDRITDLRGHD